jgi:hypothetical protein
LKISEIIARLQEIREEQGDLQVVGSHDALEIVVLERNEEFDTCVYIE